MKSSIITTALATALLLGAGAASAQNVGLTPNFGDIRLQAGFTPDPYRVNVIAGGSVDGGRLPGACTGMISDAPDFRVTYTAGQFPLVFRTVSSTDTTLIINGADGRWYCDDDSFGDGDAQVRINQPGSGTYDIWVGVFSGDSAQATLIITETP